MQQGFFDDLPDEEHAEEMGEYSPPADGWHKMTIVGISDEKETKSGDGAGYTFTLKIVEGDDKGREINYYCLTKSSKEKGQRLGLGKLNSLAKSVGLSGYKAVKSPEHDMFHKPFDAELKSKKQKGDDRYWETNVVKWGYQIDGDPPRGEATSSESSGASSSGGDWRKRQ